MFRKLITSAAAAFVLSALAAAPARAQAGGEVPREWIDPDTGHRVVRLSEEPGTASLYFHQNAYTPDGRKLIVTTPTGLATIDLRTHAVERIVEGRVGVIVVGRKSGQIYYVKYQRDAGGGFTSAVYATDLTTKATREVAKLPPRASVSTVNADETLLGGAITEGELPGSPFAPGGQSRAVEGEGEPARQNAAPGNSASAAPQARRGDSYPGKGEQMERRLAARIPMRLITIDTRTGEVRTLHRGTDWFNHIQFSPTDPTLLMFCHEGPWHKVDRTWTIRTDGTQLTKIHPRTVNMEIAGHEFFSADGRVIWYDLQTPRGVVFWLAGYNLETGERTWYHLERPEWSVHYNVSSDGKLFAGDGGGPNSVAAPGNGQWIYLFRPEMVPDRTGGAVQLKGLVKPGVFKAERMVNLAKHDYTLEPNVTFTPDMKWLVFRSNMFGPTHVFAVEIEKGGGTGAAAAAAPPELTIAERRAGDVTVLDLSGRVGGEESRRSLRGSIERLLSQNKKKVLLNLARVSYVDGTSGVAEFVSGWQAINRAGGQVKLLNLTRTVKDLLTITKLLTVFDVYDDERAALSSFK